MGDMSEKVHSGNITSISLTAAFNKGAAAAKPTPPTTEELQDKILSDMQKRIDKFADKPAEQKEFVELKSNFEKYLKEVSLLDNFELVPVVVNPMLDWKDLDKVYKEFDASVRKDFLNYVATNHADELKEQGASKYAINLMKAGVTSSLPFSVDHIMERASSDKLSVTQEIDSANPNAKKPSFLVNHFNNMVLLPNNIHELKNEIKDAQLKLYSKPDSRYFLMLVPKKVEGKSGFVAPKQTNEKYAMKPQEDHKIIRRDLNYLDRLGASEILSTDVNKQTVRNVTQELKELLGLAQNHAAGDTKPIFYLKNLFDDQRMKNLCTKICHVNQDCAVELKDSVLSAKSFLYGKEKTEERRKIVIKKSALKPSTLTPARAM